MKYKFIALLLVAVGVFACETPPVDDSRVVTDGTYADGIGSEYGGLGGGELAPGVYDTVYFATDSSVLDSGAKEVLNAQASWLKDNAVLDIVVEGHCDERATREYNLALGERRANAIKRYLISSGVDSSRVSTISYGKERPAVAGS
ncbi:MAG: peptidoglycan-associated lipoprotein, partial [Alphaproteobacteria bacterium CG11_big_fil_rev_8_21_14_0_20_44_7]